MIDNDLNVLGSHFNYDQLAASINAESPARIPPISKDATLDISGDLTPISTCSDWEFNTNDATKGSTNTANDLTTEEDDEDATISTDTCLSTGDLAGAIGEEAASSSNLNLALEASSSGKQIQKEFLFDMKNVRLEVCNLRSDLPPPPASAPPVGPGSSGATPKVENRFRGNRIQKQISLYEKDSRTESKNLSHGTDKFADRPGPFFKRDQQPSRLHMSFDELQKFIPNVDKNLASKLELEPEKCSKTNKAMSARLNNSPTPGTFLIREGFIEPPRITRVTKSFHGKTDYHQVQVNDIARRSSDIVRPSSSIPALDPTTTGLFVGAGVPRDSANKYNKNQIRQNINTNSIGASGSSRSGSQSGESALGLGRFTTSIVQEAAAAVTSRESFSEESSGAVPGPSQLYEPAASASSSGSAGGKSDETTMQSIPKK